MRFITIRKEQNNYSKCSAFASSACWRERKNQWPKTIEKVGGTIFNNIKFFIFPFTTGSCVARLPCARIQKSKKPAQMRSNAEHLILE